MALRFRNSFTRKKEEFKPIEAGKVRLYTCGPTVYKQAHVGNFRAYMFEDLLRRYLKYKGFDVYQVMNLTDVDDKTIRDSKEQGIPLQEFTAPMIKEFFEDIDSLGIERAEKYPAATEHIPEMVELVKTLVEKGHAYEIDGNYYFKISSFPDYGKLANLDMAGLKADSTHIIASGPQGAYEKSDKFPIADIRSDKVFLAYQVNGERLPQKHGFPLRIVAEDYYGDEWVKYVYKIEAIKDSN